MEKSQILANSIEILDSYGVEEADAKEFIEELCSIVPEFTDRFYVGVLRWIAEGQINVEDINELQKLRKILKFLITCETGEFYDGNFNGLSYTEAIATLKLNLDSTEYNTPKECQYKVVRIPSYQALQQYREWTDDWCITVSEIAFAGYSLQGENSICLLLRDDYQLVPKNPGDTFPYDTYGDSIYCVILDSKGNIDSITNRWNVDVEKRTDFYCKLQKNFKKFSTTLSADFQDLTKTQP